MIIKRYGKVVGRYDKATNTFVKNVKLDKHLMISLDAWGMDDETFRRCLKVKCLIRITDDKKNEYEITAEELNTKGVVKDYGHGKQIFLERSKWIVNKQRQAQLV